MNKIPVYLSQGSLTKFLELKPDWILSDYESQRSWVEFWNFLRAFALIWFDGDPSNESLIKNKQVMILIKQDQRDAKGSSTLDINNGIEQFDALRVDPDSFFPPMFNSLFILDSKDNFVAEKLRDKGFFSIVEDQLECELPKITYGKLLEINRDFFVSWRTLSIPKIPLNSLVISDPHLLSSHCDRKTGQWIYRDFDQNYPELLEFLMPDFLECDFHLAIFTSSDRKITNNPKEGLEHIKEVIQKMGLPYEVKVSLTLLNNPVKKHDRRILSNYKYINSGNSFNYKRGKSKKVSADTDLGCWTIIGGDTSILEKHNNRLRTYSHEFKSPIPKGGFGDRVHRLLQ